MKKYYLKNTDKEVKKGHTIVMADNKDLISSQLSLITLDDTLLEKLESVGLLYSVSYDYKNYMNKIIKKLGL